MSCFFFFNDTATTEIYTLSLHDALPISWTAGYCRLLGQPISHFHFFHRSEEHTSELQSLAYLVCRLLLEKKKKIMKDRGAIHQTNRSATVELPNLECKRHEPKHLLTVWT